jgi:hypothetical protein
MDSYSTLGLVVPTSEELETAIGVIRREAWLFLMDDEDMSHPELRQALTLLEGRARLRKRFECMREAERLSDFGTSQS